MLLKRLSAIAAVFFLLTAFSSPAYADTSSIAASTAIATAEQAGIPATDLSGDSLQYIPPPTELQIMPGEDYGYLAYGSPFDPNSNGVDRYEGYNQYGEAIDNVAFHPDADPDGANFEDEDWVSYPWTNSQVTNGFSVNNAGGWDGSTQYQDSIMAGIFWLNTTTGVGGIGSSTGYTITDWDGNSLWNNLYQYVNIVMPPTEYTWGQGRMWHLVNGSLWYITIPLPPLVVVGTPVLTVTPPSATINVGGTQQFDDVCYDNGQVSDVTTQSVWSSGSTPVGTIGANTGDAQGISAGTANIVAAYVTPEGTKLTGTAVLTVQQQQGVLTVIPPSQTTNVGNSASYTATFTLPGNQPVDVTSQSTWSSSDSGIATPASTPGAFNGVAAGSVTVTASYSPPEQSALTGTASLIVTAPQAPPPSGGYTATLSLAAVNQPEIKTMMGQEIGGTLHRKANTAMWTDTVTATLDASQRPDVTPYVPAGGVVTGVTWSISNATLTYPAQNPDYTFGNPVEPTSTTSASMTPSGHQAAVSFEENWSEDGLNGGKGIHDTLTNSTVAATPKSYPISATFTLSGTVSGYVPTRESDGHGGTTTVDVPFSHSFTLSDSAEQDLTVDGTGAVPMTSAGRNYMVGVTLNPQ